MILVTSIRITAYDSEDLSRDLAKMMPFGPLGVLLVEGSDLLSVARTFSPTLLEFVLRGVDLATRGDSDRRGRSGGGRGDSGMTAEPI